MKIIVYTNNPGKIKEIEKILSPLNYPVVGYKTVLNQEIDVVEDGATFEENAIKKVQAMPTQPDHIYLADDSGLVVDALNGEPGIYSARYAGKNATSEQLCQKVLDNLGNTQNRNAHFACVIALKFPNGTIQTATGKCHGHITQALQGTNGFGYDPIFIPDGFNHTFAELSGDQKNKLSHRGNALSKVKEILRHLSQV